MSEPTTTSHGVASPDLLRGAEDVVRRLAMLHLAYARTIANALGPERGEALIREAIHAYGVRIGARTRERVEALGLEPTIENMRHGSDLAPALFPSEPVVVEGEERSRAHSCLLADVWREYGEEALGALYCLVDPAKMEGYAPGWTMVHTARLPLGDECCDIAIRPADNA